MEWYERIIYKYIKPRWIKISGLFAALFVSLVFVYTIFFNFTDYLLNRYALVLSNRQQVFFDSTVICLFIFGVLNFWWRARNPKFKFGDAGIIVALTKLSSGLDGDILNLYIRLNCEIKKRKLDNLIKIKLIDENLAPQNVEAAHHLRLKSRAKVVIWGEVDKGSKDSIETIKFRPIYFSFEKRLPDDKSLGFAENLSRIISQRRWEISGSDSLLDRDYISKNINTVSLYLLGWILSLSQSDSEEFEEGLKISKGVFGEYKRQPNLTSDDEIALKNLEILLYQMFKEKFAQLNIRYSDRTNIPKIEQGKQLLAEVNEVGLRDNFLLSEAKIELFEGRIDNALSMSQICFDKFSRDSASAYSLTFLYFYKEDFEKAFYYMGEAIGKQSQPFEQLVSIVSWYIELLDEDPKRLYLNYPIGIIQTDELKDRQGGQESLKQFITDYKDTDNEAIKKMIEITKKRIQ